MSRKQLIKKTKRLRCDEGFAFHQDGAIAVSQYSVSGLLKLLGSTIVSTHQIG